MPLECGIIFDGIPEGAIPRKVGLIWGIPVKEFGGSEDLYSSSIADVAALSYTSGLSNVTFHQPEAIIYHRENDRQFPAEYLLMETDDAFWTMSDDRTLTLSITLKRGGEFPILIRGWLCEDQYTDCSRNPSSGEYMDQQGWFVEKTWVELPVSSTSATSRAAWRPIARPSLRSTTPRAGRTGRTTTIG